MIKSLTLHSLRIASLMAFASVSMACHSGDAAKGATDVTGAGSDDTEIPEIDQLEFRKVSVSNLRSDSARIWAEQQMKKLSPRQRVAQLFIPRLDISDNARGYEKLQAMVSGEKVGGILLGKGSLRAYANLINKGQAQAAIPLMITLDGEWGPSMRIPEAPKFMSNIALGAINDVDLVERYGREVARECRELGIQVNFAPVLDVNFDPTNPVIGYRSFGESPQLVADLGAAYCVGLEGGGVMSVGKHFPGHGDTNIDSHHALPSVNHSAKQLREVDFVPFVSAYNSGMSGIMVGHLRVNALDSTGTPASLSHRITTDWLRDSLEMTDMLVFTDALAMKGATNSKENNCVSALRAGADVLLGSAAPAADIQAVVDAVKAGKLKQADIDSSCMKILEYKYRLGLDKKPHVKLDGLQQRLASDEAMAIIREMAERSVTVPRNDKSVLPLKGGKVAVVNIGAPAVNDFTATCSRFARVTAYGAERGKPLSAAAIAEIGKADTVIVALYSGAKWAIDTYGKVAKARRPLVDVFFINPIKIGEFKPSVDSVPGIVLGYDDVTDMHRVAAQVVFGAADAPGKLPMTIIGAGKSGAGVQLKKNRSMPAKPVADILVPAKAPAAAPAKKNKRKK